MCSILSTYGKFCLFQIFGSYTVTLPSPSAMKMVLSCALGLSVMGYSLIKYTSFTLVNVPCTATCTLCNEDDDKLVGAFTETVNLLHKAAGTSQFRCCKENQSLENFYCTIFLMKYCNVWPQRCVELLASPSMRPWWPTFKQYCSVWPRCCISIGCNSHWYHVTFILSFSALRAGGWNNTGQDNYALQISTGQGWVETCIKACTVVQSTEQWEPCYVGSPVCI